MDDGSRQNGWWTAHSGLSEGLTSQTRQGLADDLNTWLQYYFQMINTLHLSLTTASWRPPGFSSARILQHAIVHSMTHTISGNQVRKEHPLSRKINFNFDAANIILPVNYLVWSTVVFVCGSRTSNCPENTFQTDLGSVRQACWYFRVRQCLYSFTCLSIKIKNDNLIKFSLQMEARPCMLRHQSDMCIKRHRFTSSKEVMWQPASVCLTDCFQNKSKS